MKPISLLVVPGLLLISCGKSEQHPVAKSTAPAPIAKITPENQQSLFPLVEGNTWNYQIEIITETPNKPKQSMSGEIQYKVVKAVKDSNGGVHATLSVVQDGKQQDEQEWSTDNKGIFQDSMKTAKVPFSPKQPVIRFPVKDQDVFRWEGSGITPIGKQGTMKYAFKNDGIQQNVDTEMGPMSALFMQAGGSFKSTDGIDGQIVVNSWFTPGVGLIRYRQVLRLKTLNSSIILRLKSYNVKK